MADALNDQQIQDALKGLSGWSYQDGKLQKQFKFAHFREALSFIVRAGLEAEDMDHHPELFNVYNTVHIALQTHDPVEAVTEKDTKLAGIIEGFNWTSS